MNIILLTCVSGPYFQRTIGAYQIADFMRSHGYTVQIIDFTDFFKEQELLQTVEKFISADTLAVGVSSTFYSSNRTDFLNEKRDKIVDSMFPPNISFVLEQIKTKYPSIKTVVGGAKSEFAKDLENIDSIIHGYAEDKFLNYIETLPTNKIKKNKKVFTLTTSVDKEISVDPIDKKFSIENLNHRFTSQDCILPNETLPVEISRGCIFKCSFCAFPLNGKSKLDYIRNADLIKEEMLYNYENFGTTNYFFSDDTFNDSTFKVETLHRAVIDLPFKIKFATYLRLDLLNAHREQVLLLKEMGLASPHFGIESLNQKSASSIGKGMNVNRAKDFLLELYHDHWSEEIPITCSFIIGLPHETRETITDTYNWVRQTKLSSIFLALDFGEKNFYKSEFAQNYKKFGYNLNEETGYWENEHFTYREALALAEEYNNIGMFKEDIPSSWFLMTLLNHGYSLDEARQLKIKDISNKKILKEKIKNIHRYKEMLAAQTKK
jgi:radical SAM superfamily enzyme YgiQ (UPF0313 family)